jgi:hypothetical protein
MYRALNVANRYPADRQAFGYAKGCLHDWWEACERELIKNGHRSTLIIKSVRHGQR